jgi:hypothetical protein
MTPPPKPWGTYRPRGLARLMAGLSSIALGAWGLLIGVAFMLSWPLAIIGAPMLWAWEWISGREDDDDDLGS